MNDAELLDWIRKNPEKGLKALIAQYSGIVYTVVRRNLPETLCAADAEACAAEVFGEFYLDLDKYNPSKGSIKAWLCVIARHKEYKRRSYQKPNSRSSENSSAQRFPHRFGDIGGLRHQAHSRCHNQLPFLSNKLKELKPTRRNRFTQAPLLYGYIIFT